MNPNGIKTLLVNGLSTFPIKDNPVFSNCSKSLPKNFIVLFYTIEFLLNDLRSFETYVLINNNY